MINGIELSLNVDLYDILVAEYVFQLLFIFFIVGLLE